MSVSFFGLHTAAKEKNVFKKRVGYIDGIEEFLKMNIIEKRFVNRQNKLKMQINAVHNTKQRKIKITYLNSMVSESYVVFEYIHILEVIII